MMMNKRLNGIVPDSMKYIKRNVGYQWVGLIANTVLIFSIGLLLGEIISGDIENKTIIPAIAVAVITVAARFLCTVKASKMSYYASKSVKKNLRGIIYEKLLKLGVSYTEKVSTSEMVQVSVEGVEQLEAYFGSYLPQFIYSLLAPLTLFAILSFVSLKAAVILLLCVPLIPLSIAAVQKFAKKLLSKYWDQYTALGDSFLENLQGLTTLKIYKADGHKHKEMNNEAEKFRRITMKVLTLQLNSITVMDLIAYGGAALGIVISILEYRSGNIDFMGCFSIILLSAEFFLPLRLLGSFFHIAMNGMAASDKIFMLLDLPEYGEKTAVIEKDNYTIACKNLCFSYDGEREIIHGINMRFPQAGLICVVGESGCGKSTVASLLMGKNRNYSGSITVGNIEVSSIVGENLMKNITLVSHNSYLFKGTVRNNLLIGNPSVTDTEMWSVLERVCLADFLKSQEGLDTKLLERASNLSGGQCQRLALARALLHDSPICIFDEAASNIDAESENDIMEVIHSLAETKTVILISHRLANVVKSDNIYVMSEGTVVQSGSHTDLLKEDGVYRVLWDTQQSLENYARGDAI